MEHIFVIKVSSRKVLVENTFLRNFQTKNFYRQVKFTKFKKVSEFRKIFDLLLFSHKMLLLLLC